MSLSLFKMVAQSLGIKAIPNHYFQIATWWKLDPKLITIICFAILSLIGVAHHEIWRDEAEPLLIAEYSNNLSDLLKNMRYEGHGIPWYLLLFLLAHNGSILQMQLLHLLICLTAVVLFIWLAPFTRWQKILFPFGFYPFYQYNIISRDYSVIMLLVFLFCMLSQQHTTRDTILRTLVLILLCQVGVYGIILAVALFSAVIFDWLCDNPPPKWNRVEICKILLCVFCFVFFALLSAIMLTPPKDSCMYAPILTYDPHRLRDTISHINSAYFGPSDPSNRYWPYLLNTRFPAFSILFILLLSLYFLNNRRALFPFTIGNLGLVSFAYLIWPGFIWHWGLYFLLLIACLWLAPITQEKVHKSFIVHLFNRPFNIISLLITILLICHCIRGAYAWQQDILHPYSMSNEVAKFISKINARNVLVAVSPACLGQPISALLNREVYYPQGDRFGTFMVWNRTPEPTLDQIFTRVRKIKLSNRVLKNSKVTVG